ncbi:MAG: hypothetical protein A2096_07260 [Spirochaetes bacterium GWF1_41_5]|nr:MAG: hypothetical protein A2096_07260 [Spirochaetes bacterium GWF1_41_5]
MKNTRILLIQPPLEDFYITSCRTYPLGLAFLAGYLKPHGYDVKIFNALERRQGRQIPVPAEFSAVHKLFSAYGLYSGYKYFGYSGETILRAVKEYDPFLIGINSNCTAYFEQVKKTAQLIKKYVQVPIVIGGHHATVLGPEILQLCPEIDYVVCGEGEIPLLELAGFISGNRSAPPHNILSADFPFNASPESAWPETTPGHDLLNHSRYRLGKKNLVSTAAGRGCSHACTFCGVQKVSGNKMRFRRTDALIEEITDCALKYHVQVINFEDDNLSFSRGWFMDFLARAQEIKNYNIEYCAMNGICADTLDEEIVYSMKQAGFRTLNISLIAESSRLQKQYNRPVNTRHIKNAVTWAKKHDLFTTVYLIIGLPGQTKKEILDTINFVDNLGVLIGPSVFYPVPATVLFEKCVQDGLINRNTWNQFRSTAVSMETEYLNRNDIVECLAKARELNLKKKISL